MGDMGVLLCQSEGDLVKLEMCGGGAAGRSDSRVADHLDARRGKSHRLVSRWKLKNLRLTLLA
jgi:hypothetical protein